MKSNNATLSLLLVLLVLAVAVLKWRQEPARKEAFDRAPEALHYTPDARCRMDCRQISEGDIKEIMKKGVIHFNRSNRRSQPCPTFALQGRTAKGTYLRVHFSQCTDQTTVLNCYNLERDVPCRCPGDSLQN
jgi:hypothetical protein